MAEFGLGLTPALRSAQRIVRSAATVAVRPGGRTDAAGRHEEVRVSSNEWPYPGQRPGHGFVRAEIAVGQLWPGLPPLCVQDKGGGSLRAAALDALCRRTAGRA